MHVNIVLFIYFYQNYIILYVHCFSACCFYSVGCHEARVSDTHPFPTPPAQVPEYFLGLTVSCSSDVWQHIHFFLLVFMDRQVFSHTLLLHVMCTACPRSRDLKELLSAFKNRSLEIVLLRQRHDDSIRGFAFIVRSEFGLWPWRPTRATRGGPAWSTSGNSCPQATREAPPAGGLMCFRNCPGAWVPTPGRPPLCLGFPLAGGQGLPVLCRRLRSLVCCLSLQCLPNLGSETLDVSPFISSLVLPWSLFWIPFCCLWLEASHSEACQVGVYIGYLKTC